MYTFNTINQLTEYFETTEFYNSTVWCVTKNRIYWLANNSNLVAPNVLAKWKLSLSLAGLL